MASERTVLPEAGGRVPAQCQEPDPVGGGKPGRDATDAGPRAVGNWLWVA